MSQNLFSFKGRVGRPTFWTVWLTILVSSIFMAVLASGLPGDLRQLFCLMLLVPVGWVSLATQVKRWHDLGHSGWMVLLCCIPLLGILIQLIVLGCFKGQSGPNRFGENPKTLALNLPPPIETVVVEASPKIERPPSKPLSPRVILVIVLTALVALGSLVAVIVHRRRTAHEEQAILTNLRYLALAADQYYLENGTDHTTYDKIVGPLLYVKTLVPVHGEDYTKVRFQQRIPLEVHTSDGRTFRYDN